MKADPVLAAGAGLRADAPSVAAPPRRRSRWPLRLAVLLAVGLALVALLALMVNALDVAAPVHVIVDGEKVFQGLDLAAMPPAHQLVLAAIVLVALLAALLVVPIALLLALAAVLGAVLLVVGLPLLAAALGLGLLLSPLILLGWLLWKAIAS